MEYRTRTLTLLLVLTCSLYRGVFCRTETLSVDAGDCDPYTIRNVGNDKQYVITWNGVKIPIFCVFGFLGQGTFSSRYRVCVEATTFNVTDCRMEMKFEKGVDNSIYSNYSCGDKVEKFCGESEGIVEIEFDADFRTRFDNNDKIILKVTADMTFNGPLVIGCSFAGVIGSLFLITVTAALILQCRKKSKTSGKVVKKIPSSYGAVPNANTRNSQGGFSNPMADQEQQTRAASHFPPPT